MLPASVSITDVRPGDHVEGQLQILGAAGQRPLHGHRGSGVGRVRPRKVTAARDGSFAGLVAVNPTKGCRHADGASKVTAELEWRQTRRDGRRPTAGTAAGRAR